MENTNNKYSLNNLAKTISKIEFDKTYTFSSPIEFEHGATVSIEGTMQECTYGLHVDIISVVVNTPSSQRIYSWEDKQDLMEKIIDLYEH